MIFYFNSSGCPLGVFPNRVFQGSNKASTVYFLCPTAKTNVVTIAFSFPDGTNSNEHVMTLKSVEDFSGVYDIHGISFNVWGYDVPSSITSRHGVVSVQFKVTSIGGEVTTTALSSFVVEKGVMPEAVEEGDSYQELIAFLTELNTNKQNEPNIINAVTDSIIISNNEEYYLSTLATLDVATVFLRTGHSAFLSFDSGEVATTLTFNQNSPKFVGADCINGVFVPLSNKHYEILFICTEYLSDSQKVYARVNGWEI